MFLSGGTALRELCRTLIEYTHNSIHLITPFDSGGSSAHLRRAFGMPSVGDLRNRLLALADPQESSASAATGILSHRLPTSETPDRLARALGAIADGTDPLMAELPDGMRVMICRLLAQLVSRLPPDFDLRGAQVGNLILTEAYLANGRDICAAIDEFGAAIHARGTVCPIAEANVHLAAQLTEGRTVVGQHLLTGKEAPPLTSGIEDLCLVEDSSNPTVTEVAVCDRARDLIARADLICFPMGSFHSSVAANLLPRGVGRAIRANRCPKVYIPNTGIDPEQVGMTVSNCVQTLLELCERDGGASSPSDYLDAVVLDRSPSCYHIPLEIDDISALGPRTVVEELVTSPSTADVDPRALAELLISMAPAPADS